MTNGRNETDAPPLGQRRSDPPTRGSWEAVGARKELLESEKRYRRLFESARDGILILDAETGKVVDVNPSLVDLLGVSYDSMCGQYVWDLGMFEDLAASKEAFKTLQENEYIRYEHLPLETRDGRSVDVEVVSNVYLVDNVKVIQCNIRDISARKRAESALGESEKKTRDILDNIGVGIALVDRQMKILELNALVRQWFPDIELDQESVCIQVSKKSPSRMPVEECSTAMTLRDGLVHECIFRVGANGAEHSYRIVSSPIHDSSGATVAVVEMIEDFTERLSWEARLAQSQKMEAVGLLAGGVAHDFNNMLTVILGYAEMSQHSLDPNNPLYDDLGEIIKAANHSSDITRQLLAFARIQTIVPVVLDLTRTVEKVLKMLRSLIGEEIQIVWRPAKEPCPVKMDPVQVQQIMTNLCVNARDSIDGIGTITISTRNASFDDAYCSTRPGHRAGEFVLLEITDDGCGMDTETIDRIFEPFYSSKGVGQGTGLGLATVFGIVKQNKGFIEVDSEPGSGTNFSLHLPRSVEAPAMNPPNRPGEAPAGGGETVLIVEDEPAILISGTRILEKLGYRVFAAGSPLEALAIAEKVPDAIHLLLTDVIMPGMNGRLLADRVQSLHPDIRILFMSGYTSDVINVRGICEMGVNFVQKPFTMDRLAAKVRETLDEESRVLMDRPV